MQGPRAGGAGLRYKVIRRLATVLIMVVAATFAGTPAGGRVETQASTGDPVIAAAGDIACDPSSNSFNSGNGTTNSCHAKSTSNLLVNGGFAAVLPLGDNQYYCGGYQGFVESYDTSWGRVKGITFPTIGNHEYLTSGGTDCDPTGKASGYFRYFGSAAGNPSQGYYSYDIGAWHLIALNTNCGNVGGCSASSPQGKWLAADLAAHANRCTLAYWHIPLYSSGGRANRNSASFWQALYAAHADLILSAHDHLYERFAPQDPNANLDAVSGIREFVVGTGGANHTSFTTIMPNSDVRNSTTFGVLELTLHQTGYDWQFVPEAGGTFTDSGSGICHSSGADTIAPTAPSGLAANPVGPNEVDLNWTASTDNLAVAGYRVYRDGVLVASPATNSYADRGVQPSTTHSYAITAFDAAGNVSTQSNTATATTPGAPPPPPVGLVASGSSSATVVTNLQVSLASTPGNALVAYIGLKTGSSNSVTGVTDSAGNTWTRAFATYVTGSNSRLECWYTLNANSVSNVTFTFSNGLTAAAEVSAWSGVIGIEAAAGRGNASATLQSTPSLSVVNAPDILLAGISESGQSLTLDQAASSPASGWTSLPTSQITAGTTTPQHLWGAYQAVTSPAAYAASWDISAPAAAGVGIIALKTQS